MGLSTDGSKVELTTGGGGGAAGPEKDMEMLARDLVCPCPACLKLIEFLDMREDLDARRTCAPVLAAATSVSPPMAASNPLLDWLRRCACLAAARSDGMDMDEVNPDLRLIDLVGDVEGELPEPLRDDVADMRWFVLARYNLSWWPIQSQSLCS